jgi:SAM-dependent methyltransferase
VETKDRLLKRLTDVAFWDQGWWQGKRPERLRLYRDVDFEFVRLLRREGGSAPTRVLEVGAGGSRVLPYLAWKFGYDVFGADYSFSGCRLLRANLALRQVSGGVLCEDLFQSALPANTFDLVYSSGLIEHFDDLRPVVLAHVRQLKPGGRLVLVVPNLQGFQGKLMRRFAPSFWAMHKAFGKEDLVALFENLGLEQIHSGYLGSFMIRILRGSEWTVVDRWPLWLQRSVHDSIRLLNGLISLLFRLSPARPHSRAFSPEFFASARKPREVQD